MGFYAPGKKHPQIGTLAQPAWLLEEMRADCVAVRDWHASWYSRLLQEDIRECDLVFSKNCIDRKRKTLLSMQDHACGRATRVNAIADGNELRAYLSNNI